MSAYKKHNYAYSLKLEQDGYTYMHMFGNTCAVSDYLFMKTGLRVEAVCLGNMFHGPDGSLDEVYAKNTDSYSVIVFCMKLYTTRGVEDLVKKELAEWMLRDETIQ